MPRKFLIFTRARAVSAWGADADLVIWDPERDKTISRDTHYQNVDFNIFEGMTVRGVNAVTISQGKVVYQDGEVRSERGSGRYIKRPVYAPYYEALDKMARNNAPAAVARE